MATLSLCVGSLFTISLAALLVAESVYGQGMPLKYASFLLVTTLIDCLICRLKIPEKKRRTLVMISVAVSVAWADAVLWLAMDNAGGTFELSGWAILTALLHIWFLAIVFPARAACAIIVLVWWKRIQRATPRQRRWALLLLLGLVDGLVLLVAYRNAVNFRFNFATSADVNSGLAWLGCLSVASTVVTFFAGRRQSQAWGLTGFVLTVAYGTCLGCVWSVDAICEAGPALVYRQLNLGTNDAARLQKHHGEYDSQPGFDIIVELSGKILKNRRIEILPCGSSVDMAPRNTRRKTEFRVTNLTSEEISLRREGPGGFSRSWDFVAPKEASSVTDFDGYPLRVVTKDEKCLGILVVKRMP